MNLPTGLKSLLRPKVRLSLYTTMQVGGEARYFAEPSTEEELSELVDYARNEELPLFILGKGSNVIFPDDGWPGLVITLIHYEQDKIIFDPDRPRVTVSAGVFLYRFCLACRDHRLGGSEFLANIPGTVGGALMMNAGFSRYPGQKNEISDIVEEVTVMSADGHRETLTRRDLQFSYRKSNLGGKIILSGTFQLWYRNADDIHKEIRANFAYRNEKQDLRHPSSGSIFKNPGAGQPSAGQLIDQLGFKGTRIGDAMVSPKHGNYFINAGQAKSSDLAALIREIQEKVFDASGILLEPEVRIVEKP